MHIIIYKDKLNKKLGDVKKMVIVDYTRKRKNVVVCPVCGKKARLKEYKNGLKNYVHKEHHGGLFVEIKAGDYCCTKDEQ